MILNCIAIDDEPLSLSLIKKFILETPFLNFVGEYTNPLEALHQIKNEKVHLIFLDIEMPQLNGLDFAKMIMSKDNSHEYRIIFTTAYNQFAVDGYKVDALYYLLKPLNYHDFLSASLKAWSYFDEINKKMSTLQKPAISSDYIFLRVGYAHVKVNLSEIIYIESDKDYVKVFLQNAEPVTALMNLKTIEQILPKSFIRINRSFIVSINKIKSISKTHIVIGNTPLNIGEQYKEEVYKILK
ncbi:LytR/AlgR family response regulator transcription factor [Sphingobacterium hungaricum]|uniref:DNA-binding response regulator n=1 Tax=Sphingobacterium hungaricum TaxID=2082723 RepID=A0A928YPG9_9SPHI|nr:LytTR family DNA-binding domain-containing protein [Sphingobacterium hungaricum]MBE8712482.1 DNA-binding response regulator [Sphingobacterium hungaricum]